MKNFSAVLLAILFVLLSTSLSAAEKDAAGWKDNPLVPRMAPFSLAIVPETSWVRTGGSISWSVKSPKTFYVILTNVSSEPQAVFEYWNSWGYQAISFELTTADGRKSIISKDDQPFDKNFPSKFVILPGEQIVYAIKFDDTWTARPPLPKASPIPVRIRAVYELKPTKECADQNGWTEHWTDYEGKVWTGRLESKTYEFALWQGD